MAKKKAKSKTKKSSKKIETIVIPEVVKEQVITYEIKELDSPSIKNCWMKTKSINGKIVAAWGFRTIEEAENFKDIDLHR